MPGVPLAKLMTRFGKRVAVLTSLHIEYPVGRAGARFEARLASDDLRAHDTSQLRFFVLQDDAGNRYPAMIDRRASVPGNDALTAIGGVVVAGF